MSMTSANGDTVSKSDFAKLCNVSPGRVSQWIAENKISGAAIVGEGQRARIHRAIAQDQLKSRLDVNQRFGMNGLGTRLDVPTPAPMLDLPTSFTPASAAQPVPTVPTNNIDDRIKAEKLLQSEILSRKMAEEELQRQGRFVLADDVQRQLNVLAEQMMSEFTGAMPDLANALATEYKLVARDVLHSLRTAFREIRTHKAQAAGQKSTESAALVDHVLEESLP